RVSWRRAGARRAARGGGGRGGGGGAGGAGAGHRRTMGAVHPRRWADAGAPGGHRLSSDNIEHRDPIRRAATILVQDAPGVRLPSIWRTLAQRFLVALGSPLWSMNERT